MSTACDVVNDPKELPSKRQFMQRGTLLALADGGANQPGFQTFVINASTKVDEN
jgi:hypothetical protein